ncbi:MAG TPA: hypothetical protein VF316_09580 [Polyangiaceae bacterium]
MRVHVLVVLLGLAACGKPTDTATPSASASAPPASAYPAASAAPAAHGGTRCGDLDCTQFDRIEDAFQLVLDDKPRVVAVGEAHAQKDAAVASSAKRFTTEILPLLKGRASDLLVELMQPPTGCQKQTEDVRTKQKVVTEKQAVTDQNEYVTMGAEAKKLGIVPDLLRPTCVDMAAVSDAGADAIPMSLALIKRLTSDTVKKLLERDAKNPADADKLVVTYGGALHNDLAPKPELAAWAFGPELSAYTQGKYAEVDLYVPEFIDDTDKWRKLEWYAAYQALVSKNRVTVFRPRPGGFVILFAHSLPSPSP